MTANQAQGIIEYMPTLDERKALRDYMKANKNGETAASSFQRLCECEKFMVAMMTVKQSKRKLRALLFKLQFRGCIHDLAHGECYRSIVANSMDAALTPFNCAPLLVSQTSFQSIRLATN